MARMIPLLDWAKDEFGEQAPSERVLKKYAKGKMIAPPAMKVGREWMVDKDARFVGQIAEHRLPPNANPRLLRIVADGR